MKISYQFSVTGKIFHKQPKIEIRTFNFFQNDILGAWFYLQPQKIAFSVQVHQTRRLIIETRA